MNLKLLLIGLSLCIIANADTDTKTAAAEAHELSHGKAAADEDKPVATAPAISHDKALKIKDIIDKITGNTVNGPGSPEQLFKTINGQNPTSDITNSDTPVQSAINAAVELGCTIVCYQDGIDNPVASTDQSLLRKNVTEIKTEKGKPVRDLAVEKLRESTSDKAKFTYTNEEKTNIYVSAVGRSSFKESFPDSQKKFLCTVSTPIN